MPALILPAVREHLAAYVDADPEALVFTTLGGRLIWRGNFNKLVGWKRSVEKVGQPELHFQDLRHTGNTLAARTRDLMARMGHDSSQSALIDQHATAEADRGHR